MALNMSDKEELAKQILPEVDFLITSTGITIHAGSRISPARFIPYDYPGKCNKCKGTDTELDFVVAKEGVTIFCSRITGERFIPFDHIRDLPGHCFFKIRNKGRVFNIQHGVPPPKCVNQKVELVKPVLQPKNAHNDLEQKKENEARFPELAEAFKIEEEREHQKKLAENKEREAEMHIAETQIHEQENVRLTKAEFRKFEAQLVEEMNERFSTTKVKSPIAMKTPEKLPPIDGADQEKARDNLISVLSAAATLLPSQTEEKPKDEEMKAITPTKPNQSTSEPENNNKAMDNFSSLLWAATTLLPSQSVPKIEPVHSTEQMQMKSDNFINILSAAATLLPSEAQAELKDEKMEIAPSTEQIQADNVDKTVNQFISSLTAATAGLPAQAKLKEKDEEMEAISSIEPKPSKLKRSKRCLNLNEIEHE